MPQRGLDPRLSGDRSDGACPKTEWRGEMQRTCNKRDLTALRDRGCRTWAGTSKTCGRFGVPVVVAINHFAGDSAAEIALRRSLRLAKGTSGQEAKSVARGEKRRGLGASGPPAAIGESGPVPAALSALALASRKIEDDRLAASMAPTVWTTAKRRPGPGSGCRGGLSEVPVCIAKTQYSFSG